MNTETPRQPRRLRGRNPSRSGHVTHHSDSVSNGFGRQVAAELCSHHPAASVCPGHLPPDHTGLVGLPAGCHRVPACTHTHTLRNTPTLTVNERWRCGSSLLGLVDVGAAFAEVEVDLVPAVAALELQQRRVLALVPQAALVARKDGLTPQSERETASDHVTTTC